jgi:hypothetical protein
VLDSDWRISELVDDGSGRFNAVVRIEDEDFTEGFYYLVGIHQAQRWSSSTKWWDAQAARLDGIDWWNTSEASEPHSDEITRALDEMMRLPETKGSM